MLRLAPNASAGGTDTETPRYTTADFTITLFPGGMSAAANFARAGGHYVYHSLADTAHRDAMKINWAARARGGTERIAG